MLRTLLVALAAAGCAGCGAGRTAPASADAGEARAALRAALDAWQKGEEPAARLVDDDRRGGLRLVRYQVKDPGEVVGTSLRCAVVLHLQDRKGNTLPPRTALYQVATSPEVSVVRSDSP